MLAFVVIIGVRQQIIDAGDALTWRTALGFVVAALSVMVGQKMRSIADRQAEANEAAGMADVEIACHEAQAR